MGLIGQRALQEAIDFEINHFYKTHPKDIVLQNRTCVSREELKALVFDILIICGYIKRGEE